MFNVGQRAAVEGVFRLAGYEGPLSVAPVSDPTERVFVMERVDFRRLADVDTVSQIVEQVFGCKAWVIERSPHWPESVPFE